MDWWVLLAIQIAIIVLAPFLAAILLGLDRIITARMQNRVGPPVLQVLYDFFKLIGKKPMLLNRPQVIFAVLYLMFVAFAFVLFVLGLDLIIIFFAAAAGSVFLAVGAFTVRSPYSHMGANRELLQIAAYEPVFLLALLLIGIQAGSFNVADLYAVGDLMILLPLVFVALIAVLVIKLQKSPYDVATAHQEIVSGPYIEYSGPYLAITKLGHWYEFALMLGVITLFFNSDNIVVSIIVKIALIAVAMLVVQVIDNVTARLTKERMLKFTATFGIIVIAANYAIIVVLQNVGVI
ncbi:MAG: NADH-quinone oxidoreductase subunit H [Thermoplasmata archaeon]|nr:NADH-quinone oxidoreductase subunit H [Thermoplasmata archaeon]